MEFAAFLICPIYSVLILHFFRSRPPPPLPIVQLNLKDRRGCKGWWGKWIVVCVVMMRDGGGGSRRNLHPLWRALLHSHTTGDCPSIPPCLLRSSSTLPSLVPFTALLSPVDLCILFNYTLPFYPPNCCLWFDDFFCFHLFWRMLINDQFIVNSNYELNNKISSNWQLKSANSILISCCPLIPPSTPKAVGFCFFRPPIRANTPHSPVTSPASTCLQPEVRGQRSPWSTRGCGDLTVAAARMKNEGLKKELALCKTTVTQAECWIKEKCDVFNKSNQFVQSSRKRGFRWNPQTLISSLRVDSVKPCCCEGANKSDDGVTCPTLTGSTGGTGKTNNAARTSCENHRKIIVRLSAPLL